MSLILDALRKMEQERKSRRGAARDLRPEVLRYRGNADPQPQAKPYLLVAVGLVLLLAGVGAGVFLRGGRGQGQVDTEHPAAAPSAATTATAPDAAIARFEPAAPPAPVTAAPVTQAPAAPATTAPTAKVHSAAALRPQAVAEPRVVADTAAPAPGPASASSRSNRSRKGRSHLVSGFGLEGATVAAVSHNAPATGQAPRDITLSGIAWQDERNMRRAVLNGSLVGEGAVVAGARVVEIKENKVRLSRGGQTFDIILSSALSSR